MKEIKVEKRELSADEKVLRGDSRKCPSDILRQRKSYR